MTILEEYPEYHELEKAKDEGWKKIRETEDVSKKAWYYLNCIIWAHYWRARINLESKKNKKTLLKKIQEKKYYPGYTLDIDHYTNHWLYAMREMIPEDVKTYIKKLYGYEPEKNKYLRDGYTQYYFPEI